MQSTALSPLSKARIWVARIFSLIPVLLVAFGAILKLMGHPSVVQGFVQLGVPVNLIPGIGLLELACIVIYLVPATSVLGAILLTGLLGGAVAVNLRVGSTALMMPIVLGVLAWGGLYLRDDRLRLLMPLRRSPG